MRAGLAASLALLVACSFSARDAPLVGGDLTVEREREVTADVARQIRAHLEFVNDPVLLDYVNGLGQALVAVTEPQPFLYRFALIRDDTLNAFTIGGGYIYLNSGILAQAGDACELAGVLAHEIAHVRERHIAKKSEGQGLAMLASLAAMAAVALAGADPAALVLAQGVNVALQLKHTRAGESEADREAIRYLLLAGYDPEGMVRFFQRLLAAYPDPANIPAYLYTHPAVKERVAASRVEIQRLEERARSGTGDPALAIELGRADPSRPDARCRDPRLGSMQARLARLLQPVAGGSGLQARSQFERSVTDPLLAEAEAEKQAGRPDAADLLLELAESREARDPRVPLARADLAREREDWPAVTRHLERAFQLDPGVPLVQYRLGIAHQRLGERTRAAFYLERAAEGFRAGSAGRKRAEFALRALTVPVVEDAKVEPERPRIGSDEPVTWSGKIHRQFLPDNPELRIRWRGPDGEVAADERVRMNPLGRVSAKLDTPGRAPGDWQVEIESGDVSLGVHEFELARADGPAN